VTARRNDREQSVEIRPRRGGRTAVAALVTVMWLIGAPASAHPFVQGGEAPAQTLATITLAMAHGCGDEGAGGGDPTLEVSLAVPAEMRVVDVPEADGYQVSLESAPEDERVAVVTWSAAGDGEPAPAFDLDVVIDGDPGDEIHLQVFQACDGSVYRWVGTPDDPADDPAVSFTLSEPDPDRPPPAPDAPVPAETTDDGDPADETTGDETTGDDGDDGDDPATTDAPPDEQHAADDDQEAADDAPDDDADAAAAETGDGGFPPWVVLLIVAVVVAALLAGLARRSRAGRPTGQDPADGPPGGSSSSGGSSSPGGPPSAAGPA
jgi:uncharacterized protein YcnI